MRRLFEFGCLYSGQILSYNKMLGQLLDAGNTTTLSHYLNLLDTAGLVAGLEKFAGDHIRKRGSSPKFQVHNTALIAAQKAELMAQVQQQPAEWGRIVESSIGAHLLNSALQYGFELSYWRDGNDEIDFVITYKHKVAGLEIKSGHTMKASGMAAFKKKYNPDKIYKIGESISWQEMLQIDPRELF
jgi:predicted AAA+ superfamily ATPase